MSHCRGTAVVEPCKLSGFLSDSSQNPRIIDERNLGVRKQASKKMESNASILY